MKEAHGENPSACRPCERLLQCVPESLDSRKKAAAEATSGTSVSGNGEETRYVPPIDCKGKTIHRCCELNGEVWY